MLMVNPIFSDGKEYISAIRAAEKIGYASDYIGQLCRAKKIPGELIGKSWYVDFPSLVENKKNRKLGKPSPIIQDKLNQSTVFTYEKDDKSELPKLSKRSRYVEPVWTSVLFKQAVVSSLALLIAVSAGFATLEYATPSIEVEVRQKIENVQDGGKQFLVALPGYFTRNEKLAAVSLFSGIDKFFDSIIVGFRHLKEIALNKIFFVRTRTKVAKSPPPLSPAQKGRGEAVAEVTRLLDFGSLKSELKIELESYIRLRIDALRPPIVVYSSSPSIASADLNAFKNNEVIPAIYYSVTNQSDSDMDHLSDRFNRFVANGTFENITVTGTCTGCGDPQTPWASNINGGGFSLTNAGSLTFTNFSATSTSATSTISTGGFAVGTDQFVVEQLSGRVGIGTTSPSDTLAINGVAYLASVSAPSVTSNRMYNAGGDLYWAGNVIGGSTTGTWTTDGTNVWRIGGSVGIGTTSPYAKFSIVGGTSGTVIAVDSITGFSGNLLDLKVASTTKLSVNQNGDLLAYGSTTLQNFTFVNATGTSATTTSLAISGITSSLLKTNANGSLIAAIAGTDYVSGSSFFAFPWTQTTYGNSTSTTLGFLQGFLSTASSTFTGGFMANLSTTTSATSTNSFANLFTGNSLRIGGTATTTINSSGDLLVMGSSTLQNFTFVNATGTSATTTSLAVTGITSSLLKTNANGSLIAAIAGTDYVSGSSFFAFPWTQTTYGNSTSTTLGFLQG